MAPSKTTTTRKRRSKLHTAMMIFISLVMIGVFKTGYIFFVIGLLPAILAYYLDVSASRTRYKAILCCNLSGLIPMMAQMLKDRSTSGSYVAEMMSDPMNWLTIFASAGFGFVLVITAPLLAQFIISMVNQGQIARYQSIQDKLMNDWGPEVASVFPEGVSMPGGNQEDAAG